MSPRVRSRRSAGAAPPPPPSEGFPLGKSEIIHPSVGLGCWALGRWERADEERTRATIQRALERGIRWFDTAEVYGTGRSERALGDALANVGPVADSAFIATKVSWEHLKPGQVRAALTASLHRLGRTRVDLYLVHAPDPHTPIPETLEALEELWDAGKTRAVGVSNFSLEELDSARESLHRTSVAVNQVRYNLIDRSEADPIRDYCRHHGILIEAYTPLGRGLLAGRYLEGGTIPAEVRRFGSSSVEGDRFPETVRRVRAIRDLATKASVPLASVALHWLLRQKVAPVFGASRPEQVDEVLSALAVRPPDDLLDRADEIARSGP